MDDNIRPFVAWNSTQPMAVVQQIDAHVKFHTEQGHKVAVVAILIHEDPQDPGANYQPVHTTMPPEMVLWAARVLENAVLRGQGIA